MYLTFHTFFTALAHFVSLSTVGKAMCCQYLKSGSWVAASWLQYRGTRAFFSVALHDHYVANSVLNFIKGSIMSSVPSCFIFYLGDRHLPQHLTCDVKLYSTISCFQILLNISPQKKPVNQRLHYGGCIHPL
jgi:hypothetical protein